MTHIRNVLPSKFDKTSVLPFPVRAWNCLSCVSCDITKFCHGGIPTLFCNVLTKDSTCNCKTAHCHYPSCSSSHLRSSTPTTFFFFFFCCRSSRSWCCGCGPRWCWCIGHWSGQIFILGNWDQHGRTNLGLGWHIHGNKLALLGRVRHMDACAWWSRRHLDAKGWASFHNGFLWLFPLVWGTNLTRLAGAHVLLAHAREIHLVRLASQFVLGMRETCKVCSFQDLVLIAFVVLPGRQKNWRNHEKSRDLVQFLWKHCDSWFPFGRLGCPSNSRRVSPGNDQLASWSPAPNGWWNNTGAAKWKLQTVYQYSAKARFLTLVYDVETKRSSSSTERYGAILFEPQMFLLWPCIKHEFCLAQEIALGDCCLERVKSLVFLLNLWHFTVVIWDTCHVASISVAVHIAHCTDGRSRSIIFSQCTNTFQLVPSQTNLVCTSWKVRFWVHLYTAISSTLCTRFLWQLAVHVYICIL